MRKRAFIVAFLTAAGLLEWSDASAQAAATSQSSVATVVQAEAPRLPTGPHAAEILASRRRLDSLAPLIQQYNVIDSLYQDSIRRAKTDDETVELDSTTVGPFRVVGTEAEVRKHAKYLADSWRRMEPLFKGLAVDGVTLVVDAYGITPWSALADSSEAKAMTGAGAYRHARISLGSDRAQKQTDSDRTLGALLTSRLPASVRTWLRGDIVGSGTNFVAVRRMIAYASGPAPSNVALPSGVPADVEHLACTKALVNYCAAILGLDPGNPGWGAEPYMRASFITYVLNERAGPGAIAAVASVAADSADVRTVIERLGGAPAGELISGWLDHLEAQRPRGFAGFARDNLTALFWVCVFAALAMRSTRWRLG